MGRTEHKSGSAVRPSQSHVQDLLDEALTETFPASDAIAVDSAEKKQTSTQISGGLDEKAARESEMSRRVRKRRASAR